MCPGTRALPHTVIFRNVTPPLLPLEVMMSSSVLRFVWSKIRGHQVSKYALLLIAPVFVKPLDFTPTRRPIHLRLKELWGLPLVVAGVWASLASFSLEWAYGNSVGPEVPVAEALEIVGRLKNMTWVLVAASTAILLYSISVLRWGYHCVAIQLLSKRFSNLSKPDCLFFVVNTSGWGMWLAIYGYGLFQAIKWWVNAGQPSYLPDANNLTEPLMHVAIVCALGGLLQLTNRNNAEGMRALYGGHRGLSFLVKLVGILLMFFLGSISLILG